mgnify:CR=1 FL=1
MFIVTQAGTILNCDKMVCMDLLTYDRNNTGVIKFKSNDFDFDVYSGIKADAEDAMYTIKEGFIKGATLIDFSGE